MFRGHTLERGGPDRSRAAALRQLGGRSSGLSRSPRSAPPDGAHVPETRLGPGTDDLCAGSSCSQQCWSRKSISRKQLPGPPTPALLPGPAPPCAPRAGLVLMARKTLTGTVPHPGHPTKCLVNLHFPFPRARSTAAGHSQDPQGVQPPHRGTLGTCAGHTLHGPGLS